MTKPAPVFRQISSPLDVDDNELDKLADRLSMPTMIRPAVKPAHTDEAWHPAPIPTPPPPPPSAEVPPTPLVQGPAIAPARSLEERLTCFVPAYLSDALRREAVNRRVSVRYLIMLGLQATGFEINAEDLVPDGRRTQNKPR